MTPLVRVPDDWPTALNKDLGAIAGMVERLIQQLDSSHPLRGDIAEIHGAVVRAIALVEQLVPVISGDGDGPVFGAAPHTSTLLSAAERAQISHVLRQARGNKTEAARLLGISRRSLYRWLQRLNLDA